MKTHSKYIFFLQTIVKIHTSAYSATVTQAFQSTNASNPGYLSKQFVDVATL